MSGQAREFLESVRGALGRRPGAPEPDASTRLYTDEAPGEAAREIRRMMSEQADALLDALAESAEAAAWRVRRVTSPEDAADAVAEICRETGCSNVLRAEQEIFDSVPVADALDSSGIRLDVMARSRGGAEASYEDKRGRLKDAAFSADAGITGADYGIAETGTIVLKPRRGISRLVSLAPPRHIAIIRRGEVLPSLDELFTLERAEFLAGSRGGSSMNLISGPSRTADIGATTVEGIHGPLEAYLVIIG
ncbi:MAG: LutC/YkgG family protein [Chloroflexota bacterium]